MSEFKNVHFDQTKKTSKKDISLFSIENAKKIRDYHASYPQYSVTPLVSLKNFAKANNIKGIYVKDESYRFGLNAFKVLGGSYAIGQYIANRLKKDISEVTYNVLTSESVKKELGELTFVTATDGNHGRGVAWTAQTLGQNSVVHMPKGTALERLNNIKKLGAKADITDMYYDDCVRLASREAQENGWILVQDTSWPEYEDIPSWIMQGYMTMGCEFVQQLKGVKPSHVFVQAGVGSMAAAITAFVSDYYKDEKPIITVVEPNKADCIYRTALANDGKMHIVTEDMNSIMAGLSCGEPCTLAWDILKDYADNFVSMPEYPAAQGMRILGNPLGNDPRIISGESGASCFGLVSEVLRNNDLSWLKDELEINENSIILCISTEGDTDKENYQKIVWDGTYAKETYK